MQFGGEDLLLVVDLQVDFLPGGALAVPSGDAVIGPSEKLAEQFSHVALTQDWHTQDHISFASQHPGRNPFDVVELAYGPQVLWPDHCVMGTEGARIASEPLLRRAELVIRKGYNRPVDSYSGFREADRATRTGLAGYLRERGFRRLFLTGLALDFCVAWTAIDAASEGFETVVVQDASRPIDTGGSLERALADMEKAGVRRTRVADLI